MKKIIKKIILLTAGFLGSFLLIFLAFLFIGNPPQASEIRWGVNFSQKHAQGLGLDWKENYLALIDDLGAKNIKLATYWDMIEPKKGEYSFDDLDWQVKTAESKKVNLFFVVGMKSPRWPECHIPDWAAGLEKEAQQERVLSFIEKVVLRYRDSESIKMWQVENEPFFPFGDCKWKDKAFLAKEIALVRALDPPPSSGKSVEGRPIVISDSGEGSFWITAARMGDIVGTTIYRTVWMGPLKMYLTYPLPPNFYWRKAQIIKVLFNKKVISAELQAEPWGPKLLYDSPLSEQEKTMNLAQFKQNIEFAKQTGLDEFYLWGAEWWYWMKEKQNRPEIWNEAKKLFHPVSQPTVD